MPNYECSAMTPLSNRRRVIYPQPCRTQYSQSKPSPILCCNPTFDLLQSPRHVCYNARRPLPIGLLADVMKGLVVFCPFFFIGKP